MSFAYVGDVVQQDGCSIDSILVVIEVKENVGCVVWDLTYGLS